MEKIRLSVEELSVESFEVAAAEESRGTVRGMESEPTFPRRVCESALIFTTC